MKWRDAIKKYSQVRLIVKCFVVDNNLILIVYCIFLTALSGPTRKYAKILVGVDFKLVIAWSGCP